MLKALIFDMDGVIIDSEPIHVEVNTKILKEEGITLSDSENCEFIGVRNHEMWDTLIKRHNIPRTVEQLLEKQKSHQMHRFLREKLDPIDGIRELLREAKRMNLKIALATSSPNYFAKFVLKSLGIQVFFDQLVTAGDVSKGKPDPEIYLTAAKMLDVDPKESIAIEDAPLGIKAAQAAGMRCVGFTNPNSGNLDISHADIVVSSIRDINLENIQKMWE